jgi:cell division protein FtsB
VLIFLLIFSGYHFFKAKKKNDNINQEIAELQEQIDEFEKKNSSLREFSEYLETDDFKEKEAKENLDLVKDGEKVVIVKKATVKKVIEEKTDDKKPEVEIKKPNYYYWWHYFFGIKPETSSTSSFEKN